ncbi:cytochrome P450 [Streptomyces chrestomyceticus JCM 4735]|uniref:Cytochrome P450 n=1 Tax=Streptomyces chrestomyceticus JCM 4735 TaxID=1306181 RepID=A0A7U9KQ56_9ACTN|nr:cytochrome P450 [Streptomyces chrestomyceticus JCM 4735]
MKSSATRPGTDGLARPPRDAVGRTCSSGPLDLLTAEFDGVHDVWRSASGRVYVANPEAARAVLGNRPAIVAETSDFYRTRHGVFGPRAAQTEIGRAARALLLHHLDARRSQLPRLIHERLAPSSSWPDAGNLLVHEHLADVLLHPDAPVSLRTTVGKIVTRAVLAGARRRHAPPSRLLFRHRVYAALRAEIRARQHLRQRYGGPAGPRDLLDVVVDGCGPATASDDLAEVYLSFLFAAVGSIGFALGWSVHLLGTQPGCPAATPDRIVREALRLWPVAWLFARTPLRVLELGGTTVTPEDQLAVCTYLVHRHPAYWERPDEFVPQRWAAPVSRAAYLPFGHGPHTCAGATVTLRLLEDIVGLLLHDWRLSVIHDDGSPQTGPALAPPRFTAVLSPRADSTGRR